MAEKVDENLEFVLYRAEYCGQNKNKFVMMMFMFAVYHLKIKSIQKFLICGHIQNEADTAHSMIGKAVKRALKGGPVFYRNNYQNT